MFKIDVYGVCILEYPNASRRGLAQVYTGKINRHGKAEYESADGWFETREEAKAALQFVLNSKIAYHENMVAQAKARLEKVNNL